MTDWLAYQGIGRPDDTITDRRLPDPPPWRLFAGRPSDIPIPKADTSIRAKTFQAETQDVEMVNAALYLRRPLLVTGKPGTGKSSLAHSVALELGLGKVLQWPITSRSTLKDGLYQYDAVARLQDASLNRGNLAATPGPRRTQARRGSNIARPPTAPGVGRYVTLGPLGTALLPRTRPRVLLIDELDKSDIDLPNDLLHLFEEGYFELPELRRLRDGRSATVTTADGTPATIEGGVVHCREFPLVIITSNGEREFPAAFLRRCLRLEIPDPDRDKLVSIVEAHLGPETIERGMWLIDQFIRRRQERLLATDQLLNAAFLVLHGLAPERSDHAELAALLLPYLDASTAG